MRQIPAPLQAALDTGVTTHCQCWRLTRRDGLVQGFTDHDGDIAFDGLVYRASTGFVASEAASRFDLSGASGDVAGVLADATLTETDLAAGLYDAATIDTWLVDWTNPAARLLTFSGSIGEIKREGRSFVAELRGLADALSQPNGRLFTAACAADLGDARCRVDLNAPSRRAAGRIVRMTGVSSFVVEGLSGFDDGFFAAGRLVWISGANLNRAIEIKQHKRDGSQVQLALWQPMASPCAVGDAFLVTAGCDKRFATCKAKFDNAANFRGFPHIPGNDFILTYPLPGQPGYSGQSIQGSGAETKQL